MRGWECAPFLPDARSLCVDSFALLLRVVIGSPSPDPGRGASVETGVDAVLEEVGMGRAVAAASEREKRADSPD